MWKKGKRTSPLVTWQQTRRAGGVIHQTDRLKTQTHVATLQGYPPPVAICQVVLINLLQFFRLFYIYWGVKAKNGRNMSRILNKQLDFEGRFRPHLQKGTAALCSRAFCLTLILCLIPAKYVWFEITQKIVFLGYRQIAYSVCAGSFAQTCEKRAKQN